MDGEGLNPTEVARCLGCKREMVYRYRQATVPGGELGFQIQRRTKGAVPYSACQKPAKQAGKRTHGVRGG